MEESKKKLVMIVIIVVCLGSAGAIYYTSRESRSGGIGSFAGKLVWVKCGNKACGAEYQMDMAKYFEQLKEKMQANPMTLVTPALTCNQCGEPSIFRAEKCEKCGIVFFRNAVPNDLADRCPECDYSKTEEDRKRTLEERRRAAEGN